MTIEDIIASPAFQLWRKSPSGQSAERIVDLDLAAYGVVRPETRAAVTASMLFWMTETLGTKEAA